MSDFINRKSKFVFPILMTALFVFILIAQTSHAYRHRGDGWKQKQGTNSNITKNNQVKEALNLPVTEVAGKDELQSQNLCSLLGGSYVDGKCILQSLHEICQAFGGVWEGDKCSLDNLVNLGEIIETAKRSICTSLIIGGKKCQWKNSKCDCQVPTLASSNVKVSQWVPEDIGKTLKEIQITRYFCLRRTKTLFQVCYGACDRKDLLKCGKWAKVGGGVSEKRDINRWWTHYIRLESKNTKIRLSLYIGRTGRPVKIKTYNLDVSKNTEVKLQEYWDSSTKLLLRTNSTGNLEYVKLGRIFVEDDSEVYEDAYEDVGYYIPTYQKIILPWMIRK